jgi:hypothetical protein
MIVRTIGTRVRTLVPWHGHINTNGANWSVLEYVLEYVVRTREPWYHGTWTNGTRVPWYEYTCTKCTRCTWVLVFQVVFEIMYVLDGTRVVSWCVLIGGCFCPVVPVVLGVMVPLLVLGVLYQSTIRARIGQATPLEILLLVADCRSHCTGQRSKTRSLLCPWWARTTLARSSHVTVPRRLGKFLANRRSHSYVANNGVLIEL